MSIKPPITAPSAATGNGSTAAASTGSAAASGKVRGGLLAAVLLALSSACNDPVGMPTTATVAIEAAPTDSLVFIASSDFQVQDNGTTIFNQADTVSITGNFTREFPMQDPARFTAILRNDLEDAEESVRLSVLIDGRREYDEIAVLGTGGFLQFVYRFNPFDT